MFVYLFIFQLQVSVRMWRKGNPRALLVGMQTGAATVENSMEFPQKTKNGTAFRSSDSTSGNTSKETRNTIWKEYLLPCVVRSAVYDK